MRIHRLELTAFGPFPDTEVVDFERLNDAGLFLLTGPTGAGKTSLLDAICFALFGAVPGGRNGAKAFKSDHAAADVVPSVSLEFTVRGRRMRLRRQPGWSRPSRRARSGAVEECTKASIEEYVDDGWLTHSTRVDEVGHLVTSALGMNKDQFCQVVMLPQGEFQTFLSAGAKERHDVLESLFRTHRFQAVERWLVDHRRALDLSCHDVESGLDRLLARADEVLASADIDGSAVQDEAVLEQAAEDWADFGYLGALDTLRARCTTLMTTASAAAETRAEASEVAKQAQHTLDAARSLLELQRRHREAQNRRDELMSAAAEVRRRERETLLARRAAAFEPLLDLVAETERALYTGRVTLSQADAAGWRPTPDHDLSTVAAVDTQADDLRRDQARLDALVGVEEELDVKTAELAALECALADARKDEAPLVEDLAALPLEVAGAQQSLAQAHTARTLLASVDDERAAASAVCAAARQAVDLTAQISLVETSWLEARELRADARDQLQDVRDRRIRGMAAHLAAQLSAGDPCPVCGGVEHPRLAAPSGKDTTAGDEAASMALVEAAEEAVGRIGRQRERLQAEHAAADHAAAGRSPDQAAAALAEVAQRRTEVAQTASAAPDLATYLAALEARTAEVRARLDTARVVLHTSAARHAELSKSAQDLRHRLHSVLGLEVTLSERRAEVTSRLAATEALGAAIRADAEAHDTWRRATGRLDRLVADSVFATADQVRNAVRSEADIASGEALNRVHAAEKAATDKTLTDPALLRAAQTPVPDLDVLVLTTEQAAATAGQAATRSSRVESAATRLEALVNELAEALDHWIPLRARRDLADQVASMVAGTAKDNVSKTKLSHYVLAARLEQVVAAANVRLRGICGGRYELAHTLMRGVGDARGGLGLRVLDTYTGSRRDPATLSGGETFYVSLALALGLADLVNNEIGGAELSTLFVDEGFGSLDAETLDEVMDELDALRSGGRSVGLVSHLAELRIRVPAQLSVVRSPRGSHLDDSR